MKTWPTATDEILQLATAGAYGEAIYMSLFTETAPPYIVGEHFFFETNKTVSTLIFGKLTNP